MKAQVCLEDVLTHISHGGGRPSPTNAVLDAQAGADWAPLSTLSLHRRDVTSPVEGITCASLSEEAVAACHWTWRSSIATASTVANHDSSATCITVARPAFRSVSFLRAAQFLDAVIPRDLSASSDSSEASANTNPKASADGASDGITGIQSQNHLPAAAAPPPPADTTATSMPLAPLNALLADVQCARSHRPPSAAASAAGAGHVVSRAVHVEPQRSRSQTVLRGSGEMDELGCSSSGATWRWPHVVAVKIPRRSCSGGCSRPQPHGCGAAPPGAGVTTTCATTAAAPDVAVSLHPASGQCTPAADLPRHDTSCVSATPAATADFAAAAFEATGEEPQAMPPLLPPPPAVDERACDAVLAQSELAPSCLPGMAVSLECFSGQTGGSLMTGAPASSAGVGTAVEPLDQPMRVLQQRPLLRPARAAIVLQPPGQWGRATSCGGAVLCGSQSGSSEGVRVEDGGARDHWLSVLCPVCPAVLPGSWL